MTTRRLCDVPVGEAVVICSVAPGEGGHGRRLEDLGVIAGTVITVERRAPLGDPTIYEVRRSRLTMRRVDAALVQVAALQESPVDGRDDHHVAL